MGIETAAAGAVLAEVAAPAAAEAIALSASEMAAAEIFSGSALAFSEAGAGALAGGVADLAIPLAEEISGGAAASMAGDVAAAEAAAFGGAEKTLAMSAPSNTATLAKQVLNPAPKQQKRGFIDSMVGLAEKNPTLAAAAGTAVAGGVGGAAKSVQDAKTAKMLMDAKSRQMQEQSDIMLKQSRDATLASSGNVRPSGQKVLYRADGTPVYVGGIINNAIPR